VKILFDRCANNPVRPEIALLPQRFTTNIAGWRSLKGAAVRVALGNCWIVTIQAMTRGAANVSGYCRFEVEASRQGPRILRERVG
jgi:hypothetical protein